MGRPCFKLWLLIGLLVFGPMGTSFAQFSSNKPVAAPGKPLATSAQPAAAPSQAPAAKPAPAPQAPAPAASSTSKKPQPLLMELSSTKTVYRAWDDIMVSAELWAIQPTTLCVYPQRPEVNFTVDVYRAGFGPVEVPPTVVHLSQQDMQSVKKVQLQPGQMYRIMFNLKKVTNMPPSFWKTGEYRIQTKFFLCNPNQADDETAISSSGPLHLLILD